MRPSDVVYQIYPRSFADSDGDGVGDLGGIFDHLDHLSDLGVDVVWLSPIYPSPQDDNGYDISDYQDVDPVFGTLEQLRELIDALHARGIRLVMDLVVNHTSDEHPWFVESRSSPQSPKRDWYWWRGPREGMVAGEPGAEPNDWTSFFSGSTWELDPASGEYYLHLFSRKQPDLNWENPEVRQAIYTMMRWWLDLGVDGFRMDVINMISKEMAEGPGATVAPYFLCGPRIHEFLQEMHREVFDGRPDADDLLTVGEMPGVTVEQAQLFTDPARREVDMVFQFEHVGLDHDGIKWRPKPLRVKDLKASLGRWQDGLADAGWNSLYWSNHDQPRAVSRFGDDSPQFRRTSATCIATLLHLHRGTPYVYQGEEIGMANFPFDRIDAFQDIESLNHYRESVAAQADPAELLTIMRRASRDNARTPVQWDATPNAGFTAGVPWIAVNPDYPSWNVAAQEDDPDSVLTHYRRLIALRHELPVVQTGDFTMLVPEHEQLYAFTRALGEDQVVVTCNLGRTPVDLAALLPLSVADYDLVLANLPPGDPAALGPWEARVFRRAP
jgi:oligo-1,6-glucosidase